MTSRIDQFCGACFTLFFQQPPEGSSDHHASGSELHTCAESRICNLCSHIWNRLIDQQRTCVAADHSTIVQCTIDGNVDWPNEAYLSITLPISEDVRIAQYGSNMPQILKMPIRQQLDWTSSMPADTTFNDNTANQARIWIKNCIGKHEHSKFTQSFTPTRLIDVGTLQDPLIRLCERVNNTRYLTLSHRWGDKIYRLLVENKDAMMIEIPEEELSKTFHDAIKITRMLDVRYIWIDSLCIIQNSVADWAYEAARMADYYQHAHCTLSASCADSQGLIRDRNPALVAPLFIDAKPPAPETKQSFLKTLGAICKVIVTGDTKPPGHLLPIHTYLLQDVEAWAREVDQSPMAKRGWIYQERILSSRILHFGKTRVFFECLDQQCSEDQPKQLTKNIWARIDYRNLSPQAMELKMRKNAKELAGMEYFPWTTTIQEYSLCALSFPTDRLPALAGVAQRLQHLMSLQQHNQPIECTRSDSTLPLYFEGVWLKSVFVMHCLAWSTTGDIPSVRMKTRSPSWSFGKTTSSVMFGTYADHNNTFRDLATIKKVDVVWETNIDITTAMWLGRIEPDSGALWLGGTIVPVQLSTEAWRDPARAEEINREIGTWQGHPGVTVGGESQRWAFTMDETREGTEKDNFGWSGEYFFFSLLEQCKQGVVHGIVLEWQDVGRGCYHRVGGGHLEASRFAVLSQKTSAIEERLFESRIDEHNILLKII